MWVLCVIAALAVAVSSQPTFINTYRFNSTTCASGSLAFVSSVAAPCTLRAGPCVNGSVTNCEASQPSTLALTVYEVRGPPFFSVSVGPSGSCLSRRPARDSLLSRSCCEPLTLASVWPRCGPMRHDAGCRLSLLLSGRVLQPRGRAQPVGAVPRQPGARRHVGRPWMQPLLGHDHVAELHECRCAAGLLCQLHDQFAHASVELRGLVLVVLARTGYLRCRLHRGARHRGLGGIAGHVVGPIQGACCARACRVAIAR